MVTEELFTEFPTLETNRLVLQEFQPEFATDIFKILSNVNVNQFETREPFTELSQAERYVKARLFITREKREGIIWTIALKGSTEIIGDIGYAPHHGCNAEIGFKLRPDYWNKGLITEAIKAVDHFLFTQIGINRIEATTRLENIASARVLAKNGFQKEGTLRECEHYQGKFYDLVMYSLLKREYQE
jgi:[ribosomal protein S5]-alanine N-acetyltransferase